MIEISMSMLILLGAVMLSCSVAGWLVSNSLPWSPAARDRCMPLAVGLALAPFLFGFAGIAVLALLPGASHLIHIVAALALFAAVLAIGCLSSRGIERTSQAPSPAPFTPSEWILGIALLFVAASLLFVSVFVPLTQNDSLEYATVGRILFGTRTLASYPVLDPETNSYGFFGPWTHPPLYVAAIYLVEAIQGHASAPGAIRLIAPWFALTATGVVYSTGALVSRSTGLASALFFLSTPLLFLGAGSALLDALYVSGFALLVAAVSSLEARPAFRGAVIGLMIGLGLWTHSVAILLLPLGLAGITLRGGISRPVDLAKESFFTIAVALVVGGWPYLRNIELFGSLISDNPAVFALPSLLWKEYFIINRGLDTPTAMIQYGIFKGWFTLEAFSVTYWSMTLGFVFLLVQGGIRTVRRIVLVGISGELSAGPLYLVFGLITIYLLGSVVSVLIGLDVVVKNERYLLSVQPLVAIGAGYGYSRFVQLIGDRLGKPRFVYAWNFAGYAALGLVLASQSLVFVQYTLRKYDLGITRLDRPFDQTLAEMSEYRLTEYLRTQTPQNALVLSLKPADMYYAYRKTISYLDPRLLRFYQQNDPTSAARVLADFGISYVHVPSYGIPPLYNSVLWRLLRDPAFSELVYTSEGGAIYTLSPSEVTLSKQIDISPAKWPWTRETFLILGGRKRLARLSLSKQAFDERVSRVELPFGMFQRDIVTQVSSMSGAENGEGLVSVPPGAEVAVDLTLEGTGLVSVRLDEFTSNAGSSTAVKSIPLTTFELSDRHRTRVYGQRTCLSSSTTYVAITIEQQGQSTLAVRETKLSYSSGPVHNCSRLFR